jgi:hypothetical protein
MSREEAKQAVPWATVLTVSVTLGLALLSKLERIDGERAALRVEMERRLTRIEAKLDGLLQRKGRVVAVDELADKGHLTEPEHCDWLELPPVGREHLTAQSTRRGDCETVGERCRQPLAGDPNPQPAHLSPELLVGTGKGLDADG